VYQHFYFTDTFKIRLQKKSFLMKHHGFQLENEIFWKGLHKGWEKISIEVWTQLSERSEVIIDAGANTGVFSLISKTVNPTSTVYAFEPVKRVYEKLKENIHLNNYDVKAFETALSEKDGSAVIYDPMTPHVYSVAVNKNIAEIETATRIAITTLSLKTFIEEHNLRKIDLMKIDVETHEYEVLKGMGEYLRVFKPSMLIEILNDELGTKIEELLNGLNYLYFNIDEENPPRLVEKLTKSDFYNFLICTPETAADLKLIA
jgi:FkbM family methyltransferase